MVCDPCRAAADLLARVAWDADPGDELLAEAAARRFHKDCPGGTWCCCQHRVRPARPTEETTTNG